MNPRRGLGLLVGFVVGGAIAYSGDCALGQSRITPDNTLRAESSTVVPNYQGLPVEAIAGGAVRGGNLFHSFLEFNVSAGRGAYFYSPNASIQNILARVTGSNASQILGTLGTFGNSNPNLFLINPNGITFGANASLNVGGSFVATTANAVQLGDKGLFSASEPATSNLLSINPSAFFFNSLSHGAIVNSSTATSTVLGDQTSGLQVPDGQSLLLVGGDINLNGGYLGGLGGRVELGGLVGAGTVGLTVNGKSLNLNFPGDAGRADVGLTNGAVVDVTGEEGSLAVHARNLEMSGGSVLKAGIGVGGTADSKAGNIEVDAQGAVTLEDGSLIVNRVRSGAVGQGGNIELTTGSLSLTNGAAVIVSTFGQGNVGNVTITARDAISFDGMGSNGSPSGAGSQVQRGATGKGGNVNVTAGSLSLTNGGQVFDSTFGQGDAGSVTIIASGPISFDGMGSGAGSTVESGATGKGGNVNVTAGSLSLTNGGDLGSNTSGQGDAGSVTITASGPISFDGVGSNGSPSGASSQVQLGATGKGGNINITAGSFSLTNGGELSTSTFGQGDAGSVTITASGLISFDGPSGAGSTVESGAIGKGGNINIMARSLSLTNGAQFVAGTFGRGDAGSVTITASGPVSFDGADRNGFASGAFSTVESGAIGKGGNIKVTAGSLSLTNGADLAASTIGRGDAGSVTITASGPVSFDGVGSNGRPSGVLSTVESGAIGKGGNIKVTAASLSLTNGAGIAVNSKGQGNSGDLQVQTGTVTLDHGAFLTAEAATGEGGNITLKAQDLLLLRHGSLISTTAGTAQAGGDGGNITINAPLIVAVPKEDSDIKANAFTGRGGNIQITTQGIFGLQFRSKDTPLSDITASSQFGVNGTVQINTPGVDPSRGLTDLSTGPVDASRQIAQGCYSGNAVASQQNKFVVTGRGGLPPNPREALNSDAVDVNWVALNPEPENHAGAATPVNPDHTPLTPTIAEAQGWVYGPNGEVILTAAAPTITPQSARPQPATCPQL